VWEQNCSQGEDDSQGFPEKEGNKSWIVSPDLSPDSLGSSWGLAGHFLQFAPTSSTGRNIFSGTVFITFSQKHTSHLRLPFLIVGKNKFFSTTFNSEEVRKILSSCRLVLQTRPGRGPGAVLFLFVKKSYILQIKLYDLFLSFINKLKVMNRNFELFLIDVFRITKDCMKTFYEYEYCIVCWSNFLLTVNVFLHILFIP
jgi:hypothetical protein